MQTLNCIDVAMAKLIPISLDNEQCLSPVKSAMTERLMEHNLTVMLLVAEQEDSSVVTRLSMMVHQRQ